MRLLNGETLEIHEFVDRAVIPRYAILSHTWGDEEVTFHEWRDVGQEELAASHDPRFTKIKGACAWIDTICIDKTSSAELSEAINSMFAWYRNAQVCYVYLADAVDTPPLAWQGGDDTARLALAAENLRFCRWFTRGWTLQELLAPSEVIFFSASWTRIGTRTQLKSPLSRITGIPTDYLCGVKPIWVASIAKRMSWMARRVTTRIEDLAYSMLGIFDIHMPLLYGEGSRAFLRLQEEILKTTDDHSIFCWEWDRAHVDDAWASILAPCPAVFANASEFMATLWEDDAPVVPYVISNAGLSIRLPLVPSVNPDLAFAVLDARHEWQHGSEYDGLWYSYQVCIPLKRGRIYRRLPFPARPFPMNMGVVVYEKDIYICARERSLEVRRGYLSLEHEARRLFAGGEAFGVGFLITFATGWTPGVEVVWETGQGFLDEARGIVAFQVGSGPVGDGREMERTECDKESDSFQAMVIKLGFGDGDSACIMLGVRPRRTGARVNRSPGFRVCCQVLPPREHTDAQISEMAEEVRVKTLRIVSDVDFSTNSKGMTVALGGVVPYPATVAGGSAPVVRVVHVVFGDDDRTVILRIGADFTDGLLEN